MRQFVSRATHTEPAPPWGLSAALLIVLLAFMLIAVVGSVIGSTLLPTSLAAFPLGWSIGGTLLITLLFFSRNSSESMSALRLKASQMPLLIAFALGFGVAVTLDLIVLFGVNGFENSQELALAFSETPIRVTYFVAALFVLVIQPVAEELVFRGMLYPVMRVRAGVWGAIMISAVLYGAFHMLVYAAPTVNPVTLWYVFFIPTITGIFLGLLRASSQSTLTAIVAHIGIGTFILIKAILLQG